MTIAATTYTTYDAIGVREHLMDVIYNIAPTDTPFMSGIKKGKAENVFFEWQIDTLAAAANNAQLDGDDVTSYTAVVPTTRIGNRTQISRKVFAISGTEQAVKKAGRKEEVSYQIALKGKELKRDMEFALTQNTTAITGSTTAVRQTRGLEGWVATNNSLGAGGAAPVPSSNTAPTDGTQRTLTEAMVKTVQQLCFTAGGHPGVLMAGATQRQTISTFTGNQTRMGEADSKKLVAAVDVYVGDFGSLKIIPNRFQRSRTVFLLDMDYWEVDYLRSFQTIDLAKTGDADKRMLVVEYGLKSAQEAASGAVRDIT